MAKLATDLCRRGYVCVPLRRGGKHLDLEALGRRPIHLSLRSKRLKELAFTSVLYQLAEEPPSEDTVAQWFSKGDSNIGLVCGVGGLIALDFDRPTMFQAWRDRHKTLVAKTPICRTPKGYHVLLTCKLPLVSSSMHYGFRRAGHIKALGGYVACDPCKLANGDAYRWLPGQSPDIIDPQTVGSLADVGLHPVSPFKRVYDDVLGRGSFKDH
ncbi:MAG: bifunctional DNA primase/polymerase [Pseudomonadota bacterium]